MAISNMDKPADITQYVCDPCITNLMFLIWQSRKDLQQAFDIQTKNGQEDYVYWCKVSLLREYGIEFSNITKYAAISSSDKKANANQSVRHSFYPKRMYLESWMSKASRWLPNKIRDKAKYVWLRLIVKSARIKSGSAHWHENSQIQCDAELQQYEGIHGVNLIGYIHAELGMGEHVRMSAAALSETNVPFGIFNFNVGVSSRQNASLDNGSLIDSNKYKANVFHINADAMVLGFTKLGRLFFENRYNIGYWAWELAHCPDEWVPVFGLVDEIWAPSKFIQNAFSEKTTLPVVHMPLCVTLPAIPDYKRHHYGLPEKAFIFLFTFDFFSYMERKNPFASIRAFKKAFQRNQQDVGLVIKVMNGDENNPYWKRMLEIIDGDPRIFVLNQTLDRLEVLGLFKVCNCFISLHRSEGFGRGPAEAMYLGKPVIVTNYSGNTDFTLPDNSCLVDYQLIPVKEGQYVFERGQVWADPDVEHAAWFMKKISSDMDYSRNISQRASAHIRTHYNPNVIGAMYRNRLDKLRLV